MIGKLTSLAGILARLNLQLCAKVWQGFHSFGQADGAPSTPAKPQPRPAANAAASATLQHLLLKQAQVALQARPIYYANDKIAMLLFIPAILVWHDQHWKGKPRHLPQQNPKTQQDGRHPQPLA